MADVFRFRTAGAEDRDAASAAPSSDGCARKSRPPPTAWKSSRRTCVRAVSTRASVSPNCRTSRWSSGGKAEPRAFVVKMLRFFDGSIG